MKLESDFLTLQLIEAVELLEIFFLLFPLAIFSLQGLQVASFRGLVLVMLKGCGHSGLEDLQAQGSHRLSGQSTSVLHDLHRDIIFNSLSLA